MHPTTACAISRARSLVCTRACRSTHDLLSTTAALSTTAVSEAGGPMLGAVSISIRLFHSPTNALAASLT